MKIFIGSSAKENIPKKYKNDCEKILDYLLKENDLVFGGCNVGIMGLSYSTAKKYNRKITVGIPLIYEESLNNLDCNCVLLTNTMFESTKMIFDNSDVILFMPGGIGTLYELFNILQLNITKEYNKKIIIYNSCGFFDELLNFLSKLYDEKFIDENVKNLYFVSNNINDILNYIEK